MFHTFIQNNSGGFFVTEKDKGIASVVIVECDSEHDVLSRAEAIGIYFNGVADGTDCECCGDRWDYYEGDLTEEPEVYGESPGEYMKTASSLRQDICIHYKDGRKEWL